MSLHIGAKIGDIAETVLIPGDPLRAKFVADNMLKDAECYTEVRGMYGYTGTYNGKRVSIQGGGMGMASTSIYVNELISEYGVKNLIRVGTCGSVQKDMKLGQVLLGIAGSTDSNMNKLQFHGMDYAAAADFGLLKSAYESAESLGIKTIVGNIFSTDTFYNTDPNRWDVWTEHGILGVEMETAILYTLAAKHNAKALSILTVSDNILTGDSASTKDREQSYMDMMKIALEIA
jgi:purine-nucleoside phosphorylase